MNTRTRFLVSISLLLSLALLLQAHVGSPDVYVDGKAGPYRLFVTIRPPSVIPGVAELEIRSDSPDIQHIGAVPLPLSGPGATFAPVSDSLKQSPRDPQFFTGSLWMMAAGSWQVKITADGSRGQGVVSIPIPSAALTTKKMQTGLGAILSLLMTFLVLGAVAIVGASVREAQLPSGLNPDRTLTRRAQIAMAIAFVLALALLWYGYRWWTSDADSYARNIYRPLLMTPALHADILTLTLRNPGVLNVESRSLTPLRLVRNIDDLALDHDHLMHLYVIREPGLDIVYHLHPELIRGGVFQLKLPSIPAGNYRLYADIVHENGFPETLVASLSLPAMEGRALAGDDARGQAKPWDLSAANANEFTLPDGYRMQWIRPAALLSKHPELFRFTLLDTNGNRPGDMALYMGMLGHAAFVKTDGAVFAHLHPTGSISMAAYMKAQEQNAHQPDAEMNMNMPGMDARQHATALPNEVTFPYGFPSRGRYRLFVQMKHGNTVETGIFDAVVPQ